MAFLDFLGRQVDRAMADFMKNIRSDLGYKIAREVNKIKRKIILSLASTLILIVAFIFLALALAYFFVEYLLLTKALAFLILGIIFLLIGIIISLMK